MNFHEHKRETFAVCWNPVTKDSFISSSWDGTVKIVSQKGVLDGALDTVARTAMRNSVDGNSVI